MKITLTAEELKQLRTLVKGWDDWNVEISGQKQYTLSWDPEDKCCIVEARHLLSHMERRDKAYRDADANGSLHAEENRGLSPCSPHFNHDARQ